MADQTLPLEALLAWGRDFQRQLEARPRGRADFDVPVLVLVQYLCAANEALELQMAGKRPARFRRGRPLGGGMGAYAAGLIDGGMETRNAVRVIARQSGKPVKAVHTALRRYRQRELKGT